MSSIDRALQSIKPMKGSTPMSTALKSKPIASKTLSGFPAHPTPSGSNAQTEQMARTINKTNKVQTTYGMPGKK